MYIDTSEKGSRFLAPIRRKIMTERETGKVSSLMKPLNGIATSSGIEPNKFKKFMANRWEENGYVVEGNDNLLEVWSIIAREFNYRIALAPSPDGPISDEAKKFRVIPAPTGTGKTQCLIKYCIAMSELSDSDHPGILIVTRRIEDCKKIYGDILREGRRPNGDPACIAFYTDSGTELSELSNYPVAIITHVKFQNALHAAMKEDTVHNKLYNWGSRQVRLGNPELEKAFPDVFFSEELKRKLTIVDECLDLVDDYCVDVTALRQCLNFLPKFMHERYSSEIEAVRDMVDTLDKIEDEGNTKQETLVEREEDVMPDLTLFIEDLQSAGYKHLPYKKELQQSQREQQVKAISGLSEAWREWLYYEKCGGYKNIRTSRRIVPENSVGAVVLDATAEVNALYLCTPDAEIVNDVPKNARTYRNATLHIGHGYKVGKGSVYGSMKDRKRASSLFEEISSVTGAENILVITHKSVEERFLDHANSLSRETKYNDMSDRVVTQGLSNVNSNLHFDHWFNIDGSNDYRDCKNVFILSLPYPPAHYSATSFMALNGVQDQEWFSKPKFRAFPDVREELRLSMISNNVIQGINRIATRKVDSKDGDCPECHIYILLPGKTDHVTKRLLSDIKREMPGLVFDHDWDFDFDSMRLAKTGRKEGSTSKSTVQSRLAVLAKSYPGRYSSKELIDLLKKGGVKSIRDACTKLGFSNKSLAGFPACYDIA